MPSMKALGVATKFLQELRSIDPFIPSQTVECLLVVAARPGITMGDLSEATGLAQSSCSRNIAALSKWHRLGKEGYDLVEAVDDPRERRRKIIYLTQKGHKVVNRIMQTIEPNFELPKTTAREGVDRLYSAS